MSEKWYERPGAMSPIAISTRVRLARNIMPYPFPGHLSDVQCEEINKKVPRRHNGRQFDT